MFLLLFFLSFLPTSIPRYVKPHKNLALDISRPFTQTPNIDFKLTFSITEMQIPPSVYLILNFQELTNFIDKNTGTLTKCHLKAYEETSGANFDPLIDLNNDEELNNPSIISECFPVPNSPYFSFKLNQTLLESKLYQLTFQTSALFQHNASALSIYFVSNMQIDETTYIYSSNLVYSFVIFFQLPTGYLNISLKSQPRFFSTEFYSTINTALRKSLLTYSQALLSVSDITVSSFNEMIDNSAVWGLASYDKIDYSTDIINYPGFYGNLVLELLIDKEIKAFTLFELEVPEGWKLEDSNCISVNFLVNDRKFNAIPHTKCSVENNQTVKFHNILKINANSAVRFNITNIRNPMIPMAGTAKFCVYYEQSKQFTYINQQLDGLLVKQQRNLRVSFNTTDSVFTGKTDIFLNKTQRIMVKIAIPFFDLLGKTQIIIKQNNSDHYGFLLGSCVIANEEGALKHVVNRSIECSIDKAKNILIIKNIEAVLAEKNFVVYFMNKNEENNSFINFQIDFYSLNTKTSEFSEISSYSYNKTLILIEETLKITDIYYQINNNMKVFDVYEVNALNKAILTVFFDLSLINETILMGDSINLLINKWISVSFQELNCSLNSIILKCSYQTIGNLHEISIKFNETNIKLYNNQTNSITITGLSYKKISFNAYLFAFDYYLLYKNNVKKTIFSCFKTANLMPNLTINPDKGQILMIGQGDNSTIMFSIIRFKLSTALYYSFIGNFNINTLKIKIFFQNINLEEYSNYDFVEGKFAINSQVFCQYIKGSNISSDDYLNWDRFEIGNISSSNIEDYAEIPLKLVNNPPVFYFSYYLVFDEFELNYDFYKKISNKSGNYRIPGKLNIDWNESRVQNNGVLNARHSSVFVFSVNLTMDIVNSLITAGSGFFLFFFPWVIKIDENVAQCNFVNNPEISLIVRVLKDKKSCEKSAIILSIGDLQLFQDTIRNFFEDQIVCKYLMTPTSRGFIGGLGFVLDADGNIIAKKMLESEVDTFASGLVFS